jgi:hypothetical protein
MPTTTWATMRQDILRPLGLITGSTTTNISGSNLLVKDTKISQRYPVDDYFNNRWFMQLTGSSTSNQNSTRRVLDYAQTSGTFTCAGASGNNWPASESGSITYELSLFHPDDVKEAYNEAREIVFPNISIIRDLETIVTGLDQYTYTVPSTIRLIDRVYRGNRRNADSNNNLLLNADFEDWDADQLTPGSQNNWTLAGSGATFNKEAQTTNPENYAVLHGNNSGRLAVASADTTLLQTFTPSSSSYTTLPTEGQEVNLSAWVYCNTPDKVKLYIGAAVGSFHSGSGWELLKASENLVHNATTAVVGVHVTASNVAVYIDEMWMTIGQSEMIDVPYQELRNWDHVPPAAGASNGGILRFQEHLPDKYRIRIVGRDILKAASADSTAIEIDGELLHPVYDKVRQLLCLRMAAGDPNSNWTEMARQYEASYVRAVEGDLVGVNAPPVAIPRMVF